MDVDKPDNSADDTVRLASLSVRELRQELARRGIDTAGCLEKADLIERLRQASDTNSYKRHRTSHSPQASAPANAAPGAPASKPLASLPLAELRQLLARHSLEQAAAGVKEKEVLVAMLADRLQQCPICLDDSVGCPEVCSCECCRTTFHQRCAAGHAMSAADAGRLPLLCPVPGCNARWPAAMIGTILSPDELERYNTIVRSLRDLRRGAAEPLSPRSAKALQALGIRTCPQCGVAIEKQQAGITHGCNKMTCRCGCKFCFACGMQATDRGEARCSCVGGEHAYLSHDSVMGNYADDPLRGLPFGLGGAPTSSNMPFGGAFGVPMHGSAPPFPGMPAGGVEAFGANMAQGFMNMASSMDMGGLLGGAMHFPPRPAARGQREPTITFFRNQRPS